MRARKLPGRKQIYIRRIHFYRDRTSDDIQGQNQSKRIFIAQQDTFNSRKRATLHPDSAPLRQVRVGFVTEIAFHALAKSPDLLIRQGGGMTIESHEADYTGDLQDCQPIAQRQMHEHIPWKKRQPQFFRSILPMSYRVVKGKDMLN